MPRLCPVCGQEVIGGRGDRVYDRPACRARAKRRRDLGLPLDTPRARGRYGLRRQLYDQP